MANVTQVSGWVRREVWETDIHSRGRLGRAVIYSIRLLYGIFLKFLDGGLTLQATSLVYSTLLSLVPMLAVSFSVLQAFGVENQIQVFLLELLEPLGAQGAEVTDQIVDFVSNIQVGVLGAVSIAFLFITVITLVQKVETAFNAIWCVSDVRPLGRRVSDYLSVILMGPVLIFTATAAADSIASSYWVDWLSRVEPFGTLLVWLGGLAPLLLWCAAFAVLYGLIPNTRVQISAALAGGVFAGVLWLLGSALFAAFIAGSSNYSAIYSTFAGAFLFVYWLYVGWLIILVGAQVAYYWQYPEFLDPKDEETRPSHRQAELLGLAIMALVARTHQLQQPAPTSEDLGVRLGLSRQALAEMLARLTGRGLIVPSNDEPPRYYPARDIGAIPLAEVLEALRRDPREPEKLGLELTPVALTMAQLDRSHALALKDQTVRDLIRGEDVRG